MAPIADATAAGSIRVPAAYSGLFGLKPTRGRVSAGPDFDEVFNGLVVQLGVSRTVRDGVRHCPTGCAAVNRGDPCFAQEPSPPYAQGPAVMAAPPSTRRVPVGPCSPRGLLAD